MLGVISIKEVLNITARRIARFHRIQIEIVIVVDGRISISHAVIDYLAIESEIQAFHVGNAVQIVRIGARIERKSLTITHSHLIGATTDCSVNSEHNQTRRLDFDIGVSCARVDRVIGHCRLEHHFVEIIAQCGWLQDELIIVDGRIIRYGHYTLLSTSCLTRRVNSPDYVQILFKFKFLSVIK